MIPSVMARSEVETSVPPCGSRRRSSMLAKQVLAAIRETDDETFDEMLQFDFVALGGGVAAGYWVKTIAESLAFGGLTAAIVSGDPAGLVPFERPALSMACLNPASGGLRDFSSESSEFPFVCNETSGEPQAPEWYKRKGITILSGCQAVFVDLDKKFITVKRITSGGTTLVFGETIKVEYGRLLIATGARARRISDSTHDNIAKGLQASCFCSRHPDLIGSPLSPAVPVLFGFGSVHYLRDLGDTLKLLQAMGRVESDGQDTCKDPVVLIGGGFVTWEVAAALIAHYPDMSLVMVLAGDEVLEVTGLGKEVCRFYEKQLARAGVLFARGYRATRLWPIEEEGTFPTLERSSDGVNLKKTLPRRFGLADPHFTECRGVILSNKRTGEEIWLASRFVVAGIGSIPNSELFRETLALSPDGGIMTDPSLRTSHSSRDVFAAGDVAYVPVPLTGDNDANFPVTSARHEHVRAAQDMGALAARVMMGGVGADEPYDPVPCMYSRFLELSWKFYGFTRGDVCVLGMETFPTTRTFGAFWLLAGRIVGAFLEADPSSGVDHAATLERIARERPRVLSMKRLRKRRCAATFDVVRQCSLERLLADPYCLEPPPLGIGEFHADTDESSIEEAFRKHAGASNKVKKADMASVMQELGADWDADELVKVLEALDPTDSGLVHLSHFASWWSN